MQMTKVSRFYLQPNGRAGPAAQQLRQSLPVLEALSETRDKKLRAWARATNRSNEQCLSWSCRCRHVGSRHESIDQAAHLTWVMHHHSCRAWMKAASSAYSAPDVDKCIQNPIFCIHLELL